MSTAKPAIISLIANTIRVKTLSVTFAVILLGQGLAWHDLKLQSAHSLDYFLSFMILSCCLLLQIAVNLANDYFDGLTGIDNTQRVGPQRAIQAGLIRPNIMARAIVALVLLACLLGLYLIYRGGWVYLGLGALSLFGVYAYSGGKKPLASLGLGEVAVFIYFGLLAVVASYTLQVERLNINVFFPAIEIGLLIAAIMLVNNIRDIESDLQQKKFTLAVRIGRDNAQMLFCALMLAPFILIIVDPFQPIANALLLPFSMYLCHGIYVTSGAGLNRLLAQTSLLVLLWSVIYMGYLILR